MQTRKKHFQFTGGKKNQGIPGQLCQEQVLLTRHVNASSIMSQ